MGASTSSCVTAPSMPGTFSTMSRVRSSGINLEQRWEARSRRTSCFSLVTTKDFSNAPQSVREHFGLLRFDYTASNKDSLSVNYTMDRGKRDVSQPDPNFVS